MTGPVVTRFAPSPTGPLHLGHAAAALFARQQARAAASRFLLRIEDIDPVRCRPEYASWIEQDLAWLGLGWDEPVRTQSNHFPEYAAALRTLAGQGLLYPCFCTRAEILREAAACAAAPHAPDGALVYPGTCRRLTQAERQRRIAAAAPFACRLDMQAALRRTGPLTWHEAGEGLVACQPEAFGDIILARKDAPASYHLCVTHDDAAQGVTLVTRGADLRPATSVHRLLQALFGWPEPRYAHHRLLHDAAGRRLSKRAGSPALRDLRAQGLSPQAVLRMAQAQSPP